jgi:6-phosphogluconolactonase (cycloisomerase 2 family)
LTKGIAGFAGAGSWACAAVLSLAACSGGVSSTNTSASVAAHEFTVGGTMSGLSAGSSLALQNNGADTLNVGGNGPFTFATTMISGDSYNITVLTQPSAPNQTCVVTNGSGTVGTADVISVNVVCTAKTSALDTIGGYAAGVLGSGLVLQDNGGDNLAIAANGAFIFPTALPGGTPYSVSVLSPPINPYQNCVITQGAGTTGGDNVTDVSVSCKTNANPAYTIGGTATGVTGAGAIVLQDNGRDNLTVSTSGPFQFAIPIPSGSSYNVTSLNATGPQSETCVITNASGTVGAGNVTNVSVACTANVVVSVKVSGLSGTGLVLQDNGGDNLGVTQNGTASFATALPSGTAYRVTLLDQPANPSQNCTVSNGSGIAVPGAASSVTVNCLTNYSVGGTVTGLAAGVTGLVLQDNDGAGYPVTGNGGNVLFTFPALLPSGTAYAVTVQRMPTGYYCDVVNGAGTVTTANIASVAVNCVVIGGFIYVTNGGAATISSFVIDTNSGALMPMPGATATGTQPSSIVSGCSLGNAGPGTLYVANEGSNSLSAYTANLVSGALTLITTPPIATGDAPAFVDFANVNACVPIALNGGGNSASAYVAGATTGALTPVAGNPFATSTDPAASANMTFTNTGSFTVEYIANKGSNDVGMYSVANGTGVLALLTSVTEVIINPVPAGTNPTAVATQFADINAATFPFVYVANQGSNNISEYQADTTNGVITPILDVNNAPILAATGNGPTALNIVNYQNTAYYVYVANGTDDTISGYTINLTGTGGSLGQLMPLAGAPTATGTHPVAITQASVASGTYLYVVNLGSNNITVFQVNLATGALGEVLGSPYAAGAGPTAVALQYPPDGGP